MRQRDSSLFLRQVSLCVTSEGEILKFRFAPVLPCNDVIYLERRWVKCGRQLTVFTASGGSLPNPADEISVQCA
jgi:hypothetical protein